MEDKAQELLRIAKGLPGVKVITITLLGGNSTFRCEMSGEELISPNPNREAELLFLTKVNAGMLSRGGLIICQMREEGLKPKKRQPYQNVYGVYLGNGTYTFLSPQAVEQCYNTCSRCGEELPPAEGVFFKELPTDLI